MKEDKPATSLCLARSGIHGALVVKNLLDIIYASEFAGCQNIELAFQVITLATEWECEAVLKILKKDLTIQALINSTQGPSNDHLRLAYKLGDHHLMALIAQRDRSPGPEFVLSKGHHNTDATGVHKQYDRTAVGLIGSSAGIESPFFEIGGFSYAEFLRLPPTVVWALARSTYLARKDYGEVDVDVMAQHFETLLKSACKSLCFPQVLRLLTSRSSNRSAEGHFSTQGTVHSSCFSSSVFRCVYHSKSNILSRSWAFRRRVSKVIRPEHFHIQRCIYIIEKAKSSQGYSKQEYKFARLA
jgi:hypothetical protein